MFGQSDDSSAYLFSKLMDAEEKVPSTTPVEIQHDMVVTSRFTIEHGPDDPIHPKIVKLLKFEETIAPSSEKYDA